MSMFLLHLVWFLSDPVLHDVASVIAACFYNFLISSLIYYCVFVFKLLFMQHDERRFSNSALVFFSLSSVLLTMVMSMSLSEYGPSVNITFIVV